MGPGTYEEALAVRQARELNVTGCVMRGWVLMDPHTVKTDLGLLEKWLQHCQSFVATLAHKKSNSKSG